MEFGISVVKVMFIAIGVGRLAAHVLIDGLKSPLPHSTLLAASQCLLCGQSDAEIVHGISEMMATGQAGIKMVWSRKRKSLQDLGRLVNDAR